MSAVSYDWLLSVDARNCTRRRDYPSERIARTFGGLLGHHVRGALYGEVER